MKILAIDPGTTHSGAVVFDSDTNAVIGSDIVENEELRRVLRMDVKEIDRYACEMVASYGMPVGAEVFRTVWWTGRFAEAVPCEMIEVYRKDVLLHLCHSPRGNDATIRQAIIDRFGGKVAAIGNKANPGPLHSVKSHAWQALAVALYVADTAKT